MSRRTPSLTDPVGAAVSGPAERHRVAVPDGGHRRARRPVAVGDRPATARWRRRRHCGRDPRPSPRRRRGPSRRSPDELEQPLAGRVRGELRRDLRRSRHRDAVAHHRDGVSTVDGDEHGVLVALVAQAAIATRRRPTPASISRCSRAASRSAAEGGAARLAEVVVGERRGTARRAAQGGVAGDHHHDLGRTALARSTRAMRSPSVAALRAEGAVRVLQSRAADRARASGTPSTSHVSGRRRRLPCERRPASVRARGR